MYRPITEAARVFLENYRPLLDAENQAYEWLEDLWKAVRQDLDHSSCMPVGGQAWDLQLLNDDGQTRRSLRHGSQEARPYGLAAKLRTELVASSKAKATEAITIAVRDLRVGPPVFSSADSGDLVHFEVNVGSESNYKRLRMKLTPQRFDQALDRLGEAGNWTSWVDKSQVLWSRYLPLRWDGNDVTAIASEIRSAAAAVADLLDINSR